MAFIQNGMSGAGREAHKIVDFTGGINNRTEHIGENQVADMLNMEFDIDGTIRRRDSVVKNGDAPSDKTTIAPTGDIRFFDYYKPYNADPTPILSTESHQYFYLNGVWDYRSWRIYSGINFKGMYLFTRSDGLYVVVDTETIKPTTYVTEIGPRKVGRYMIYKVISPSSYTPLDDTHTQGVTHWNHDYLSVEYRPCKKELADPYKGVNTVPTNLRWIADLKGRVYTSTGEGKDDDVIYITDVGNPFYFPPGTGLQVDPNSDSIQGLSVYDDGVLVFRKYDVHIIRGVTNNPTLGLDVFSLTRLNVTTGMLAPNMASRAHTHLFYVGNDSNVYSIVSTTYNDKRLNVQLLSKTVDLNSAPFDFPKDLSTLKTGYTTFADNKFYIFYNNKFIVFDYERMAWYRNEGAHIGAATVHIDGILRVVTNYGQICKFENNAQHSDLGAPFRSYVKTGRLDMGQAFFQKIFKGSQIVSKSYDGEVNGEFRYIFDERFTVKSDSYERKPALFGSGVFGKSFSVASDRIVSLRQSLNQRAHFMEIEFELGKATTHFFQTSSDAYIGVKLIPEGSVGYVIDIGSSYLKTGPETWKEFEITNELKPAKIYQIDFEYEIRGRR